MKMTRVPSVWYWAKKSTQTQNLHENTNVLEFQKWSLIIQIPETPFQFSNFLSIQTENEKKEDA
jgi:hypothetical protein